MTYKEITELLRLINKLDLAEFKVKEGDFELLVRTDKYNKGGKSVEIPTYSAAPRPQYQDQPAPQAPARDIEPAAPSAEKPKPEAAGKGLIEVKSPMVGTFYRSASPDKPPYIKVGDKISKGSVVCIVEAMKLFNEIESEVGGTVVQVMIEDGSPVEYDQVLFLVDPA